MRHAKAVLFYIFILIFSATAVVTLLGLIGTLSIPDKLLMLLVPALLIELAVAVIALFKNTSFFDQQSDNLATSLGSALEALDSISDEVKGVITNSPVDNKHIHKYLIRKMPNSIAAYHLMQVITADNLDKLPTEERKMIYTYEKSMNELLAKWQKNNSKGNSILDPKIKEKQMQLIRGMKEQIVGLLDYMQRRGIYLDDHYQEVRELVSKI